MASGSYRFDRFRLDPANRRLWLDETPVELNARYLDALILLASLAVLPPRAWLLSLAATAVLNLTLAINHRPGRYLAR